MHNSLTHAADGRIDAADKAVAIARDAEYGVEELTRVKTGHIDIGKRTSWVG